MAQTKFDKQLEENADSLIRGIPRILAGRDLDGVQRTNATFWRAGTRILPKVEAGVPRRSYQAGWRRLSFRLLLGSKVLRAWESSWVVGVLQTPDYARAVSTRSAELHQAPRDVEEAVRARIRRQELLYSGDRRYHIVVWEPALRPLICSPSVLAAQLDRLTGVIGMDTVELGIVPLTASLKVPPGLSSWIYDDRQVVTETWHAEL